MHKPLSASKFKMAFFHPKYWGIWLLVGALKLLNTLPYHTKMSLGKRLGRLFYVVSKKRRERARENIHRALPELSPEEVNQLNRNHFESLGISIFESMTVWWGDHRKNKEKPFEKSLIQYEGLEHLNAALKSKKGVIILVPHFTTTDIIGLFLSFKTELFPVYRPHDNPFMDYLITKGRTLDKMTPISKLNTRGMIKTLKQGQNLGFLPDQKFTDKGSIDVPFFNDLAPSNPATSKLAKLTACLILPTFLTRLEDGSYRLKFYPPIENFASGDDYQDTLRLHKIYETEIRKNPSQYLWVHNRWARP